MKSFSYLELWSKTPLDLGLPRDQVDPGWEDAMIVLKNAVESERQSLMP